MRNTLKWVLQDIDNGHVFPFFWQHGEDEQTLRDYMRAIQDANIRSVCVESRPHPDFCGEKWWQDMDVILDEARKRDMTVWILDDSHFPTGYANGALENADENLCRQGLVHQIVECGETGTISRLRLDQYRSAASWSANQMESFILDTDKLRRFSDDRILSITAVKVHGNSVSDLIDLSDQSKMDTLEFSVPEGSWKIVICQLTRNRGPHRNYINMMDKSSCRILIDSVYEPHYAHYKDDFGKTILGFFSDEPEIGNGHLYEFGNRIYELDDQAWSSEVEIELRVRWKENFNRYLPLLWEEDFSEELTARVRYDYMDVVTNKVKECFSEQIGDWCRAHGVSYIGHLIEDNNQHTRTGSGLGHYFRGLSGQDMAGIDDIGGQVLPQGEWYGKYGILQSDRDGLFYHYTLAKLGTSLAAIDPKKKGRTMCEIFGNYGWEEGVHLEKYLADHFLVRGVNYFVPHAFSAKEFPDPDCPPHFYAHGNNPQYRHFGELMKYMNRMSSLISGGKVIASAAILYNATAEWTGEYMNLQDPAAELYDRQIDYTFIPEDVFADPEYFKTKTDGGLSVNGNAYRILLIPGVQYLTGATADAIHRITETGGKVWFIGRYPDGICDTNPGDLSWMRQLPLIPLNGLGESMLNEHLQEIRLKPANNRIRALHYQRETDIYFFVNEGTDTYAGAIHVPSVGSCVIYDGWNNALYSADNVSTEDGTLLKVTIVPGKSLCVVFDDVPQDALQERFLTDGLVRQNWNNGWNRSICRSIDYPAFEMDKMLSLPDTLEQEKPLFSGFVRYEKNLRIERTPGKLLLEITDASEGVEVFVNGKSLGIQIAAPYQYDLSDSVREGENGIAIEVATTLEREMSAIPDPMLMSLGLGNKTPVIRSGITGDVYLYHLGFTDMDRTFPV